MMFTSKIITIPSQSKIKSATFLENRIFKPAIPGLQVYHYLSKRAHDAPKQMGAVELSLRGLTWVRRALLLW